MQLSTSRPPSPLDSLHEPIAEIIATQAIQASRAADILNKRFASVAELLPRHSRQLTDARRVHALRVACRRAEAEIKLFSTDDRQTGKLKKAAERFRAIRRSLGELRDHHVLVELVADRTALAPPSCRLAWAYAAGVLAGQAVHNRDDAFQQLAMTSQRKLRRSVKRSVDQLLDNDLLVTLALNKPVKRLRQAATLLAQDGSIDSLHGLRIAIKRARYTADFIAQHADQLCLSDAQRRSVRLFLELAEQNQKLLGELNDRTLLAGYLRTCIKHAAGRSQPTPESDDVGLQRSKKHGRGHDVAEADTDGSVEYDSIECATKEHPEERVSAAAGYTQAQTTADCQHAPQTTPDPGPALLASLDNALADTEAQTESLRLRIVASLVADAAANAAARALLESREGTTP